MYPGVPIVKFPFYEAFNGAFGQGIWFGSMNLLPLYDKFTTAP